MNEQSRLRRFCILSIAFLILLIPSQINANSPTETILLTDEFSGTSLNTSLWTFFTNGNGSQSVSGGEIQIFGGTIAGGGAGIDSNQTFTQLLYDGTVERLVLETRIKVNINNGGDWGFVGPNNNGGAGFTHQPTGGLRARFQLRDGFPTTYYELPAIDSTAYHIYRVEAELNETRYYLDNVLVATHPEGIPADNAMLVRLGRVSLGQNEVTTVDSVQLTSIPISYPIVEEFDAPSLFNSTDPSRVFINNGQVIWNLTQSVPNDQYIYRSIPEFQGNVRITFLGQINSHSGNHHAEIGLGDGPGMGVSMRIGFTGTGCPTSFYHISGRDNVNLGEGESPACNFFNWLVINNQTPYIAQLTLEDGAATLDVDGVGTNTGTTSYTGIINTLWIGNGGGSNFPGASGTIDYVIIEPLNANQPPSADAGGPYQGDEGSAIPLNNASASDPDGDPLTYAWSVDSPNCSFSDATILQPDITCMDNGAYEVSLTVDDGINASVVGTATVTVQNVAPVVDAGPDQQVFRNEPVSLTGTWTDPAEALDNVYAWTWDLDGDGVTDDSGSANFGDVINANSSFADAGVVTLTFTVTDKDGGVGSDTVDITVVNQAPIANSDVYTTDQDTLLSIPAPGVLSNDSDSEGDPLTAMLDSGPISGTLMLNADGSFDYTPNVGFFGTDSFTYYADDGLDTSNITTVTIIVNKVITTCGGFNVIELASGAVAAPSFSGTLIMGSDGYDWLNGTSGPDLILGLKGPDDIFGKDGDDVICGGQGVDIIYGQKGNDILYGDQQPDWLIGGPDDDILYGGPGWDDLEGNAGQDTLHGEEGYDVLLGGNSHDNLLGGLGPDDLYGNKGDDDLSGGPGNDFCKGGPGNDTISDCEGASSASVTDQTATSAEDIVNARSRNDGDGGEYAIYQRIREIFVPVIGQ
ncbi:MAG: Ig-like domain-containing protein [Chloroflexota bacterium]